MRPVKSNNDFEFEVDFNIPLTTMFERAGLKWVNSSATLVNFPVTERGRAQFIGRLFEPPIKQVEKFIRGTKKPLSTPQTPEQFKRRLQQAGFFIPNLIHLLAFKTFFRGEKPGDSIVALGQQIIKLPQRQKFYPYLGYKILSDVDPEQPVWFLGLSRANGTNGTFDLRAKILGIRKIG